MVLRPFFVAVRFLTRLPIAETEDTGAPDVGNSLLWYPAVGLLIGVLLVALYWVTSDVGDRLSAALLLSLWVMITGGLHLDGLADSADAWAGGLGSRDRTLAIMKDPHCGPVAVVTLVLVLILKLSALQTIASKTDWAALLLAPVLGRTALVALFLTTPYVRAGGLGKALADQLPRAAIASIVVIGVVAIGIIIRQRGVWLVVIASAVFVLLRALMIHRIGGTTGDTAGALVELIETAMLIVAALT